MLTASWSPCIQIVISGRHRAHGQPSAIRWSDFQRLRAKRILKASASGRFVSAAPGTKERTDSLAFVGFFLSRNGAGIPSFLIRKPTCASFTARKAHSQVRKTSDQVSLDDNWFCDPRVSRRVKKRKERPPKDSRPKEKRFSHPGGKTLG